MKQENTLQNEGFAWSQPIIAIIIVISLTIFGSMIGHEKAVLPIQLFSGVLLGIVLTRSRFGFAGGIKRIYVRGEGSLTKALLVMLFCTMLLFLGIQWFSAQNGAIPAFQAAEGQAIIPGTQNVHFANLATVLGGILFGMGMIFAGGCASGTLTDMGEGEGRAMFVFIFFILGSAPGEWARYTFDQGTFGKIGIQAYLPEHFGFFGAFAISILLLLAIYWLVLKYEARRKAEGTYANPLGDWEDFEKPLIEDDSERTSLFSFRTYHKLFIERLSFKTGAVLIAIICTFILLTTNKAWGVTSAFSKLEVAALQLFGVEFTSPAFAKIVEDVNGGLLQDGGTIRNFGIVAGSAIAFLLAGRFKFAMKLNKSDLPYFVVGGLLMGFGARLAKGCNAGAMYSAISTFSISGWIFTVAMVIGGLISLKVFAGKMSLIPAARNKK
ncbi:YeeE/YedE family protein [Vagococcus sp.]|uniref:YeeE/YedE family protein n=1 Tax=Vagococcus sp. TaxID=1933889 RepID=UPI003F9B1CF9